MQQLSVSRPDQMLACAMQQMAAVCKPGGQIILLQHGKATWDWLNQRLDDEAPAHHVKWGCWWNRDILQLVEQV